MARKKEYQEEEVLEKAMKVFWQHGYHNTSMQMLEKEMGINKFSIYASFGSKHGLFLESFKAYQQRTKYIFEKLINANNGVEDIKTFFYDFVDMCYRKGNYKGCLIINSCNEFTERNDVLVNKKIEEFINNLKGIIIEKLKMDKTKSRATIRREANYLLLAKHGLATATKVYNRKELNDYIDLIFKNI